MSDAQPKPSSAKPRTPSRARSSTAAPAETEVLARLVDAEDFPAAARQVVRQIRDAHTASLDAVTASSQGALDAILKAQASLDKQLDRDDVSAEERSTLTAQIVDLAKLAAAKDTETKGFIRDVHLNTTTGAVVTVAVVATAGAIALNPAAGKALGEFAGGILTKNGTKLFKALPKAL